MKPLDFRWWRKPFISLPCECREENQTRSLTNNLSAHLPPLRMQGRVGEGCSTTAECCRAPLPSPSPAFAGKGKANEITYRQPWPLLLPPLRMQGRVGEGCSTTAERCSAPHPCSSPAFAGKGKANEITYRQPWPLLLPPLRMQGRVGEGCSTTAERCSAPLPSLPCIRRGGEFHVVASTTWRTAPPPYCSAASRSRSCRSHRRASTTRSRHRTP